MPKKLVKKSNNKHKYNNVQVKEEIIEEELEYSVDGEDEVVDDEIENEDVETEEKDVDAERDAKLYINKMKALFGKDADIRLEEHLDTMSLDIFVSNALKASALSEVLPTSFKLSNGTKFRININPMDYSDSIALVQTIFANNPAFIAATKNKDSSFGIFSENVVQFEDYSNYGVASYLLADLANELVPINDIEYVTSYSKTESN